MPSSRRRCRSCCTTRSSPKSVNLKETQMNVALIGASGNIGTKILDELTARGHAVTAIARNTEKVSPSGGVKIVAVDAADTAALANALRGHDAVISAAPFAPGLSESIIAAVRQSGVQRLHMANGAASL